jgi:ubiquitin C-terminal hydrolase
MSDIQKRDCSDIVFMFGGETITDIRCTYGHSRYTFDRFLDLTVSFPNADRGYTLSDLLKYEFRPEILEGVDCEQCRCKMNSVKSTYLYNTPPNLVIHINRFRHGLSNNVKINAPISFDEIMDIPI